MHSIRLVGVLIVNIFNISNSECLSEGVLSLINTGLSLLDIVTELLMEVILGPQSWVAWLVLLAVLKLPVVASLLLGILQRFMVVQDIFVNAKVWNWVINWMTLWWGWKSSLAASRAANWVTFKTEKR